jgi:hypothetical protein
VGWILCITFGNTNIVPCFVLLYFLCIQQLAILLFFCTDDCRPDSTTARVTLEEDRQAEAISKEFTKGTFVLGGDPSANLFAIHNMMSPGRRIMRSSAIKDGKKWCWQKLQRQIMFFGMQCLCSIILFNCRCIHSYAEEIHQHSRACFARFGDHQHISVVIIVP